MEQNKQNVDNKDKTQ